MKKSILLVAFLVACNVAFAQKYEAYGEKFSPKKAISVNDIEKDTENVKITGEVESVCQAKGCWMKLKLADGNTMRVSFKDYGFFVPKDIEGKQVVISGDAKLKEMSVDEQRHYAKDAGKSDEEIAKITEPTREMAFVANGVLIKK